MTSTHIPFEGVSNFRDLAFSQGHQTNGIRAGKIFRSDNPAKMSRLDRSKVAELKIDAVFDFRDPGEMAQDLGDPAIGTERVEASLLTPGEANPAKLGAGLKAMMEGQSSVQSFMAPIYDLIDDRKIRIWRQVFERLNKGQIILFHCTAGRDRTGITAALIQLALGVERQSLIDDHLLSNRFLQAFYKGHLDKAEAEHGKEARAALEEVLLIKPWMMETFLDRIDTDFGSPDALLDHLGADRTKLKAHYK